MSTHENKFDKHFPKIIDPNFAMKFKLTKRKVDVEFKAT